MLSMADEEYLLRIFPRLGEFLRLFISLSAGAILLIATFLHDPPRVPGAKWFVLFALVFFFISFWCFVLAMQAMIIVEKSALFIAWEDTKEESDPNKKVLEFNEVKSSAEGVSLYESLGRKTFLLGVSSMFVLGVLMIWNWP